MAPPVLILTGTCIRLEKLENAPRIVPIKIKVCSEKGVFVETHMVNPFYGGSELEGDGFNIGKSIKNLGKKIEKGVEKAAPIVDKIGDLGIVAGTVTGQPEIIAAAGVAKAASALAGGSEAIAKKKKPLKALRYKVITTPSLD